MTSLENTQSPLLLIPLLSLETDPAFTNKRKFLSSDYMYQQMKWNPDRVPKRIGDGFYEQQLLADQILKQTGKRHLEGYTDDEAAFLALMDAGIAYAKKMNLTPGISLSDLMGGVIGSEAAADKNKLSTGTFSFSDRKNEADYSAKSVGASYHKYGNYKNMIEDEQDKVYNTKGLAPSLSMPAKGDAGSTTKSAVAAGTIDIRKNPKQDISALSRDTKNARNELGRIFDKQKMEERQELAKVFG